MLDILYGNNEGYMDMFIGLVPFNWAINITRDAQRGRWMYEPRIHHPNYGQIVGGEVGCLFGRYWHGNDHPMPRLTPAEEENYAVSWPNEYNFPGVPRNYHVAGGRHNGYGPLPPTGVNTAIYRLPDRFRTWCDTRSGTHRRTAPVSPMRSSKTQVRDAINAMTAGGNNVIGTRIDLGAVWAWRMLDPRWRGYWNHQTSALPLNYNTPNMDKVAIILSDGMNCCDGFRPNAPKDYSLIMDEKMLEVCEKMKDLGIRVYTIAFNIKMNRAKQVLQQCARMSNNGQPQQNRQHYFDATGGDELNVVFAQIADSLMSLRLSR